MTFCLGITSCFIVVVAAAVMQTLLGNSPLIFLQEAESSLGQVDLRLWRHRVGFQMAFLNFTRAQERLQEASETDEFTFASPRLQHSMEVWTAPACNVSKDVVRQNNSWMYLPRAGGGGADLCERAACLWAHCGRGAAPAEGVLLLVNNAREERMGTGRQWELGELGPGETVVHSSLANDLGVAVGDTIIVRLVIPSSIRHALAPDDAATSGWAHRARRWSEVGLPLRIVGISRTMGGKVANDETNVCLVEMNEFYSFLSTRVHPSLAAPVATAPGPPQAVPGRAHPFRNPEHFVREIIVNFPPEKRLRRYATSNTDFMQDTFATFGSNVIFALGFPHLYSSLPILDHMRSRSFVTLYLGFILDILLFILFALSTILIYSLLVINVGSRMFEVALRRVLGATRPSLMSLLAMQALFYAIPAWVAGLLVAEGAVQMIMGNFAEASNVPVQTSLSPAAVGIATLLALAIPLCAAIGPISTALGTTLRDALDVTRPKSNAVRVTLERSEDFGQVSWAILVGGTTVAVFGFVIYYVMPLALLSMNLSLFFNLFFAILLGLLFGLVLLAMNLEAVLEQVAAAVFLRWWERLAIVKLSLANLVAHRIRNRKTMVMYSLAIAFVVFVFVAANQEVQVAEYSARREIGAPLSVDADEDNAVMHPGLVSALDRITASYEQDDGDGNRTGLALDGAWITQRVGTVKGEQFPRLAKRWALPSAPLPTPFADFDNASDETVAERAALEAFPSPTLARLSRVSSASVRPVAVSPGLFDVAFQHFLRHRGSRVRSDTGLSVSEQLHTISGGQGIVVPGWVELANQLSLDRGASLLVGTSSRVDSGASQRSRSRILGMLDAAPALDFSRIDGNANAAVASFPTLTRWLLARGRPLPLEEMPMQRWLLRLKGQTEGAPGQQAVEQQQWDAAREELEQAVAPYSGWSVRDARDDLSDLGMTLSLLNFVFSGLAVVAMFLCFFSLLASMITSIQEQRKEVGILLALGLPPWQLVRVYVHEAFLLVVSASMMGTVIGSVVAWLFGQQRTLFSEVPVSFIVPWPLVIVVVVTSAALSLLAAGVPARRLTRKPMTSLIRGIQLK